MDEIYMEEALKEARKAASIGEVPIGAVIVKDNKIIGRGYNRREIDKDPTAHAEMIAIKDASKNLGGWRLIGCSMYVTVEPCPMCAGAIMLSRIDNLIIGTMDPKGGACGSIINIPEDERYNHVTNVTRDILKEECSNTMKEFFRNLRKNKKKT